MAIGTITIDVDSMKTSGAFITNPARKDNGLNGGALLFSSSLTESAFKKFPMPTNYASGLIAKLQYSMASDITNKVAMKVEIMAVTDDDAQDVDTASFDSVNEVAGGSTVPPTSAGRKRTISITCSNDDGVAAGDLVYFRGSRDHDDADDTASGDLELRTLVLEYTTT